MPAEFDQYAEQYVNLKDPFRDRFAPDSHFYHEVKWALIQDFCLRANFSTRQAAWLDVGCGAGDLLRLGSAHFQQACGCDPSRAMLEHCAGLNVRLQECSDSVPFPERSFDLVTAVCVYHHVEPRERLRLTENVLHVLRPGGIFCIIEHNPFNPAAQWIVRHCPVDVNAHLLSAGSVRKLMQTASFKVIETNYFLYFPAKIQRRLAGLERHLRRLPLGGQYAVFGQR